MKYISVIIICLVVAMSARGQSALQDMVKTEQAFSKMAEEQNMRDAFVAFIADDASSHQHFLIGILSNESLTIDGD